MTNKVRVLLTETDRRAADHLAGAFERGGHEVLRCRAADDPSFPCRGVVAQEQCPLESDVDVAVAYRAHPYPKPTTREDGISCAIRHEIPVVVAGQTGLNPFAEWTKATAPELDAVESAVWAARAPLTRLTEVATAEARRVVRSHGFESSDAEATVFREDGRLVVDLWVSAELSRQESGAVAVRIADVLRRAAPLAGSVDVRLV